MRAGNGGGDGGSDDLCAPDIRVEGVALADVDDIDVAVRRPLAGSAAVGLVGDCGDRDASGVAEP